MGSIVQPWSVQTKNREWDWDWITINTICTINDDNGYKREDLVGYFLKDVWGFVDWSWVPRFIVGDVPDEGNA
eukprot:2568270-Ditylum_brightwellii.AAC.1